MALRSDMTGPTFLRSDADFGRIRLDAYFDSRKTEYYLLSTSPFTCCGFGLDMPFIA